jgi:hypothetical protein
LALKSSFEKLYSYAKLRSFREELEQNYEKTIDAHVKAIELVGDWKPPADPMKKLKILVHSNFFVQPQFSQFLIFVRLD